jgi:hypothetical protein
LRCVGGVTELQLLCHAIAAALRRDPAWHVFHSPQSTIVSRRFVASAHRGSPEVLRRHVARRQDRSRDAELRRPP